jgi:hypothetical protein
MNKFQVLCEVLSRSSCSIGDTTRSDGLPYDVGACGRAGPRRARASPCGGTAVSENSAQGPDDEQWCSLVGEPPDQFLQLHAAQEANDGQWISILGGQPCQMLPCGRLAPFQQIGFSATSLNVETPPLRSSLGLPSLSDELRREIYPSVPW